MKKVILFTIFTIILIGIAILKLSQKYWHQNFKLGSWKENFFSQLHPLQPTPTSQLIVSFIPPSEWQREYSLSSVTFQSKFNRKKINGGCWLGQRGNFYYLKSIAYPLPLLEKGYHYHLWLKTKDGSFIPLERLNYNPSTKKGQLFLKIKQSLPSPAVCLISQETELLSNKPEKEVIRGTFKD